MPRWARLLVVFVLVVWVSSVGAALWAAERGRQNAVRGCQRSRLDRIQNADAWEAAYWARKHAATLETGGKRANDLQAAAKYQIAATGLRARVVDCSQAFPPAWGGS